MVLSLYRLLLLRKVLAEVGHRIGVVTVTYNSQSLLRPFLRCVFSQTIEDFLLYAVDNCSQDGTVAILRQQSDRRLRCIANPDNRGVAEGNNQGIRAALEDECETILLLNNDTEFGPDLFLQLHTGLADHGAEMTTCKMLYADPPGRIWCAGGWLDPSRFFSAFHYGMNQQDQGQFDFARRVSYSPTCCLLVRKSVFERIGFMDHRYFVYQDDVDFCYRCWRQDIAIWYLPRAVLRHKVSALTGGAESEFAIRYMTRNRAYFLRKHLAGPEALLWATHFLLITAPKRLLTGSDSLHIWRLRCKSLFEGWRMASG